MPQSSATQRPAEPREDLVSSPAERERRLRLPETHVVFLVNFVAPNLLGVFQQLAARVKKFTVVSSVPVESNREWKPETDGLDVRVQRTWTITRNAVHPSGYQEPNYIHIPLDTFGQLRGLKPDVVVSLELGARSLFSNLYRRLHPRTVHVAAVLASERSEAGRGGIRGVMRRSLLKLVDGVTYNGPSCKRYLLSLGVDESKLSSWDYAADPRKAYRGPLPKCTRHGQSKALNVLTVGQLSERKGITQAAAAMCRIASAMSEQTIHWSLVGGGPLREELSSMARPRNLQINLVGHCDPVHLRDYYRDSDVMLFPTLGDEWGLVVDESFASGLPVIGSCHSQACQTLIRNGYNGFVFDPENESSLIAAFDQWSKLGSEEYTAMRAAARECVVGRTPTKSALQMLDAIVLAMHRRGFTPAINDSSPAPVEAWSGEILS